MSEKKKRSKHKTRLDNRHAIRSQFRHQRGLSIVVRTGDENEIERVLINTEINVRPSIVIEWRLDKVNG